MMTLEGTIRNGVIVPDGDAPLPDGMRVRYELLADDESDEDFGPPPANETREEFLASLRESVADARAGTGGIEARAFLKQLALKHGLPLLPGE